MPAFFRNAIATAVATMLLLLAHTQPVAGQLPTCDQDLCEYWVRGVCCRSFAHQIAFILLLLVVFFLSFFFSCLVFPVLFFFVEC